MLAELVQGKLYAASVLAFFQSLLKLAVLHWVQLLKAQIFKLSFETPDTKPIGEGREDVHAFLSHSLPLLLWQRCYGAHVVQAVCQLDQNAARICHAHQSVCQLGPVQWPVSLLISVQLADGAHPGDFADHVHQRMGKVASKLRLCHKGVVKDVVQ